MTAKEFFVKRLVSRLYGGGTANRVVATTDGNTMTMEQVASAMIAANAVVTAAVRLAPSITQTTTSLSLVAMTSGSVSFTTSAQNGRVYCFGRLRVSNSGANVNLMYLYKNGSIWQEVLIQSLAAGEGAQIGVAIALPNDLAASTTYTFELRWSVTGGTATFQDGALDFVEFKR